MNYLKLLRELYMFKRNEKKSYEQIKILQETQLREMLAYAYEKSSYYRRTFMAARITKGNIGTVPLSQFPTLSKTQLLTHFDELITVPNLTQADIRQFDAEEAVDRNPFQGKYHIVHSSGSTGKPGYFLYDEAAWSSMLLGILRGALWDLSMPQILKLLARGLRIVYLAATDGRYGGAMAVGDGIDGVHASQLYLDIKTPLAEWISQLRTFRPNMLIGYPSAIKILAELVERGELDLKIVRVVSCGEPLGSSLRQYLETVFQAQVINFYGASESLALGVETDPKEGIILFDDMNVIEAAEDGMYLTCLYNFAQPLIRYRISDKLTLEKPGHASRYPFMRATGLLGRNEDILWFTDAVGKKEFLHPLAIEGFCIEGLLDYQFRKISDDTFEMLAETAKTASKDTIRSRILDQMNTILAEKQLSYVQFYVRFVDEILPDPQTGKKRLIVWEAVEDGGTNSTAQNTDSEGTASTDSTTATALYVRFGDSDSFAMHLYDNATAAAIAGYVGTSDWQLPLYHYNDYDHWEIMQYYDVPSRYEIPSDPETMTMEQAGTVYYSEPNRIVLFFGDAEISGEYTPVGYFDVTDAFISAVENNPVVEGWSNKLIHISAKG